MKPLERKIIGTADEMRAQDSGGNTFYYRAGDVVQTINGIADIPAVVREHFIDIIELPRDTSGVFVDAQLIAQKFEKIHSGKTQQEQNIISQIADTVRNLNNVPYVDLDGNPLFQKK